MARHHPERAQARDRLARQAARELLQQQGLDVDSAIARARRRPELREVPAPPRTLVHRHLEALQMHGMSENTQKQMASARRRESSAALW